jgi:PAS domain-containing protein
LFIVETAGLPIFDTTGNFIGYRGTVRDITERKRAENELIETKKHLENLIEISLDPIIIGDNVGHITKPNRAFLEMIGYTEEEVVGKMTYEFSIPEEGPYESTTGEVVNIDEGFFKESKAKIEELFERGMVSNWVSWYVNKEKKVVPITQNIVFLFSGKGERIVFFGYNTGHNPTEKSGTGVDKIKRRYGEPHRNFSGPHCCW